MKSKKRNQINHGCLVRLNTDEYLFPEQCQRVHTLEFSHRQLYVYEDELFVFLGYTSDNVKAIILTSLGVMTISPSSITKA